MADVAQPAFDAQTDEVSLASLLFDRQLAPQQAQEYDAYLAQLTQNSLERLNKEPEILNAEARRIKQQMQDLALQNYKTFIASNECIHDVRLEMIKIGRRLDDMLEHLPKFSDECQNFCTAAQTIAARRATNRLTMQYHSQLLEILEIPQLMDTCVRNSHYEEALQLCAFAQKLQRLHPDIKILQEVAAEVALSTEALIAQLHLQLRTNIQLPACLKIIGFMRRLDLYTEQEMRMNFLKNRDAWVQGIIDALPTGSPYTYLTKVIDLYRVHVTDIITQYRAIFADDSDASKDGGILYEWIVQKVSAFLTFLEQHLSQIRDGSSLALLLDQSMYFGMSLGRVDVDFRGLLPPIFERHIYQVFSSTIASVVHKFIEQLKLFKWTSARMALASNGQEGKDDPLAPPPSLIEFSFVAAATNGFLAAFNELRHCAPISLEKQLSARLEEALAVMVTSIQTFRTSIRFKTEAEDKQFARMCTIVADVMLPFIARCFSAVYHLNQLLVDISVGDLIVTREPANKPALAEAKAPITV